MHENIKMHEKNSKIKIKPFNIILCNSRLSTKYCMTNLKKKEKIEVNVFDKKNNLRNDNDCSKQDMIKMKFFFHAQFFVSIYHIQLFAEGKRSNECRMPIDTETNGMEENSHFISSS